VAKRPDEELILFFYGEHDAPEEVERELAEDAELSRRYATLTRELSALDSLEAPEPRPGLETRMWARVGPELQPETARRDARSRWILWGAGATAAATIALVGFLAGRTYRETPTESAVVAHLKALPPEARMPSADAPVFNSLLRYSSGLDDAGPNDVQIIWFDGVGADDASLGGGRVIAALMHVYSSGRVRLRSRDPHVDPVVEFGMLSDPRDLERLRAATRKTIELVRHPMVESVATDVVAFNASLDQLESDAALDKWLRANVADYVHAVGTCRMGARDDPAAVVDTDCRVIGYEGLRVCDASVMPTITRANTHAATVMIAEKGADLIAGRAPIAAAQPVAAES